MTTERGILKDGALKDVLFGGKQEELKQGAIVALLSTCVLMPRGPLYAKLIIHSLSPRGLLCRRAAFLVGRHCSGTRQDSIGLAVQFQI